jgi:hypothetical protein
MHTDLGLGFEHDDFTARVGERTANGEPDDAGTHDNAIQLISHSRTLL